MMLLVVIYTNLVLLVVITHIWYYWYLRESVLPKE